MALLTVQDATDGAEITTQAAESGGDQIPQGTRAGGWSLGHVLLVVNGDAAEHTVTVAGMDPVTVGAGATALIPVWGVYLNAPRDVTYDAVTSVTVAAVRVSGS